MSDGLKLTSKKVYEKKFPKDLRGYDAYEVDLFLDEVIADYKTIEHYLTENDTYVSSLLERIRSLESSNKTLKEDNERLYKEAKNYEIQVAAMSNRLDGIKESDRPTAENLVYIRRLNNLEEFFRAKGYTEAQLEEILRKE